MTGGAPLAVGLLATPVLISAGQVLFKLAGTRLALREGRGPLGLLLDPYLVVALGIYGLGTLLWVWVLSKLPLRQAYPVMALTYLLVPAASKFVLSEDITLAYWGGAVLVVLGVAVMTGAA